MDAWSIVVLSVCLCLFIRAFFTSVSSSKSNTTNKLPPGPSQVALLWTLFWLPKSSSGFQPILKKLTAKYGPMLTLPFASRPIIFIADRFLAHQALIQNGAIFSDRPKALAIEKIFSSDQHTITLASYGSTWRAIRRNLSSEMLHPSRIKSFGGVRKRVLDILLSRLKCESESSNSVKVVDHLQYAMFCLLVFMCFGDRVDDKQIKDIERVQRRLLLSLSKFDVLNIWPSITKILLRDRWNQFRQLVKDQHSVLVPLIRARWKAKEDGLGKSKDNKDSVESIVPYVDTLLELELPEEKRKLNEGEIVSLCSELLDGGTDTTSTALEWILANLVKYPHTQLRVVEEIREIMGAKEDKEVKEEYLQKLPYLKAVVLEGLRRHPPGHLVLPHAVTEDVVLNGYLVPKSTTVNFMVADMAWDPKVWDDPMAFKPERFLSSEKNGGEAFDITGSKEIKMLPFGVGRRMCPGYSLALLHLEYFVANLIWNFEWKAANEGDVDLSEKQEFTVVMKHPLNARISPRL